MTQGRELLLESPLCWPDYELLDSGEFEKLERFGDYILCRPEPKALWSKSLSQREWDSAVNMKFVPGAGFGKAGKEDSGSWKMVRKMPEQWRIRYRKSLPGAANALPGAAKPLDLTLRLGLTSFKHVGVFPEQALCLYRSSLFGGKGGRGGCYPSGLCEAGCLLGQKQYGALGPG